MEAQRWREIVVRDIDPVLMTTFQAKDTTFSDWHYRRDPTHVVFYREATLKHVAERFGWRCEFPVTNVALMHKAPN